MYLCMYVCVCMYVRIYTFKWFSNKFQHSFETTQRIWTEVPTAGMKPTLATVMKEKILGFARRHRHWTLAEWKKVLFSDECTMQQSLPRRFHVRLPLT